MPEPIDFSTTFAALNYGGAAILFILCGGITATVGFAKWLSKKVGRYFG